MQERGWGEWGDEIVDRETIDLVGERETKTKVVVKGQGGCVAHVDTGLRKFLLRHFPDSDSDFLSITNTYLCLWAVYYYEEKQYFRPGSTNTPAGTSAYERIKQKEAGTCCKIVQVEVH